MAEVFGVFGAQAFVVLVVAVLGLVPVVLYFEKTPRLFLIPFAFLFVGAFTTNFENVLLPDVLNLVEHTVGNLGAGLAMAAAAYLYRKRTITAESDDGEAQATDPVPAGGD